MSRPVLRAIKHQLPPVWDGHTVQWDRFEEQAPHFICPPPKETGCACGDLRRPLVAAGLRMPLAGEMMEGFRRTMGRFGRWVEVPTSVPARPVRDLFAQRCQGCGVDEVWDMRTDEWWELDESDYGPEGSERPVEREWSGGLFDLLP